RALAALRRRRSRQFLPAPQDGHDRTAPPAHDPRGGLHPAAAPRVIGTDPRPVRSGTRVPLRITLVALLVALMAVALSATGFAATSLLTMYLQEQRDTELSD